MVIFLGISVLCFAEPQPQFHWNFDKLNQKQRAPDLVSGSKALRVGKWSENGGINGSGAIVCESGRITVNYRFKTLLSYTSATVEFSFKPTASLEKESVLFCYARHSYGYGIFTIFLDGKGHIGAKFRVRDEKAEKKVFREMALLGKGHHFEVGKWYTVRVTMKQGGLMKIYLNGRLDNMVDNSMCFADLKGLIPMDYPILALGWRQWQDGKPSRLFTGLIDDVRIWKGIVGGGSLPESSTEDKSTATEEAVIVSKNITVPPVIDGKLNDTCWRLAEKTYPLKVLRHLHSTITGLLLEAEEKFVKNAATVQICNDDKNLYVAYRVPAPEDTPAKSKITQHDDAVWSEDCVELFVDPMQRMSYYQILVNAIGTTADIRSSGGAEDRKWESDAEVKVQRDGPGFIVEMAVPFDALGNEAHSPGTAWGINFTREGASGGGLSTWAPVGSTFATPEKFGLLIFGSRKLYYETELRRLKKKLLSLPTKKFPNLTASARQKISSLRDRIETEEDKASYWVTLYNITAEIDATLQQIAMKGRAYILWQKDIWGNISPDEKIPFNTDELTGLKIFTAQNTYASTGFVVSNLSAKPLMGRFILKKPSKETPLLEGTTLLEARNIEFRRSIYIELDNGLMIPDALAELPVGSLVEVPPRTTTLVWIEIDTHNLNPGKYIRKVKFLPSYSKFKPTTFNINLEVAPVDLAAPKVQQFAYLANVHRTRFPYIAKDLVRHGTTTLSFMPGQHRGYPKLDKEGNIISMDFTTLNTMIANMEAAGVSRGRLNILIYLGFQYRWYRNLMYEGKNQLKYGTDAWKKGFANSLKAIRDHLLEKGFTYKQFAFYIIDEPNGDPADPKSRAYLAFEGSQYVKEIDPKFRVMCNPGMRSENIKYLPAYIKEFDILEPYRPHLNSHPSLIKLFRESGREIWTYHILGKSNTPTVYRNLSWQSARDGFTGSCAWWVYEGSHGDVFNSYDFNISRPNVTRDYAVVYGDWEMGKIISSRRWEASYQGNQDYRTIVICRELILKLKSAGKNASFWQKLLNQTIASVVNKSSLKMDAGREKLIRAAVQMQNILCTKDEGKVKDLL